MCFSLQDTAKDSDLDSAQIIHARLLKDKLSLCIPSMTLPSLLGINENDMTRSEVCLLLLLDVRARKQQDRWKQTETDLHENWVSHLI